MKIIKLKKKSFFNTITRRISYSLLNFFFIFNQKKIILYFNKKIKIKINNIINYKFIFQNNTKVKLINSDQFIYEEEESLKIISYSSKDFIFIDIGSHHGYFSFLSSNFFKEIYSVELSKIFLYNQKKISRYNNLSNLKFFNYAIYDGKSKISYTDYLKTYTSDTITLIDFLKINNLLKQKIFLKIDINGFEMPLISDISQISENIDHVIIDIYLNFIDRSKAKSLLFFLIDKYINVEVLTHLKNFDNKFCSVDKNVLHDLILNEKHTIITLFLSKVLK